MSAPLLAGEATDFTRHNQVRIAISATIAMVAISPGGLLIPFLQVA